MRKIFIIFFVLIAFSTIISCGSGNNIKPNIVWLVAEDQSQYFFPFYGDNSVTLPNISQLLENGIVYDGMNSPYPVCAPARSAIITGMYPNSIGTGNQRAYNYNRTVRTDNESNNAELYNLKEDPGELNDLSLLFEERKQILLKKLNNLKNETNANKVSINPNFKN